MPVPSNGGNWAIKKYAPFKKQGDGKSYTPKLGETKSSEHLKRLKQWGKTRGK